MLMWSACCAMRYMDTLISDRMAKYSTAAALVFLVYLAPCFAQSPQKEESLSSSFGAGPNAFIDLLALISGHCKTLKVDGRSFACKTVAYAHGDKGRVNFAVAVDDPDDESQWSRSPARTANGPTTIPTSCRLIACCSIPRVGPKLTDCRCRPSCHQPVPAARPAISLRGR